MLDRFKAFWQGVVLAPVVRLLLRLHVSPDAVTLVGTIGVAFGALFFFPRGELFWGVVFITCFVFSDLIDGAMARASGQSSPFGAFLDSTLDRVGDAAIFGGLMLYYAGPGDSRLYQWLSLVCLMMGSIVSYARAKAESLGYHAEVGIAERSDRLVSILVMTGLSGLFVRYWGWSWGHWLMEITLWALAIASTITVLQRVLVVRKQAFGQRLEP